jgi:hypothetical protein
MGKDDKRTKTSDNFLIGVGVVSINNLDFLFNSFLN